MATAFYIAVFERAKEGFSVFFPDLPGCTSAGETLRNAVLNAEEALAAHLVEMAHGGDSIPEPSDPADIERDPEVDEYARMLIQVERPGRAVRINITMDEGLISAIDKVAKNRSGFLAEAARHELKRVREATYSSSPIQ